MGPTLVVGLRVMVFGVREQERGSWEGGMLASLAGDNPAYSHMYSCLLHSK